eukprot:14279762-Ditylum_brightwellii.AAC.1
MEKRMEPSNSTYNHFIPENTHFQFCMSEGTHTYPTRNPLPDNERIESIKHHVYDLPFTSDGVSGYK